MDNAGPIALYLAIAIVCIGGAIVYRRFRRPDSARSADELQRIRELLERQERRDSDTSQE